MTRAEAWLHHFTLVLVGGTGLAYGWMRYLVEPTDEFSIVNHPLEPEVQYLHVLFAPLLVFAIGLIFRDHVWIKLRSKAHARRRGGWILTLLVAPMIFSGYLIQISTGELVRLAWIWIHGVTSCLWIGGYLVHQLSPRRRTRRTGAARSGAASEGSGPGRAAPLAPVDASEGAERAGVRG